MAANLVLFLSLSVILAKALDLLLGSARKKRIDAAVVRIWNGLDEIKRSAIAV
jgi:hypothetical protein